MLCLTIFLLSPRKKKKLGRKTSRKPHLPRYTTAYTLNTSKAAYVRAVGNWCYENLTKAKAKNNILPPKIELSYYFHRTKHGQYISSKKTIKIYVNNHQSIEKLTDTIIHEFIHFLEIRSPQHEKEYNVYHRKVGYLNNPYEISAREKAEDNCARCIEQMREKNYLLG